MGPLVAHLLAALSQPPTLSTVIHVTFKAAVLYIRHWNLFCISLDMELSEEVKSGLKLLSASQPSSVAAFFDQIALRVMDQCPVDAVEAAFSSLSIAPGSKGLVTTSVSSAVVEGARQSVGEAEFCSVLDACGLKKDCSKEAARVFAGRLSALRVILMRTGSSLPRVQDVEWRLDYTVASKVAGKGTPLLLFIFFTLHLPLQFHKLHFDVTVCTELDPFYLLRFDTDADPIQFACNPQQMQDLVATIQDALKQTERELL
jgi:hypothetical protein